MKPLISHLTATQVLDSRGYPTVSCSCHLTNGLHTTASVPSGASTGTHEAIELRDGNPHIYDGKGVLNAIDHILSFLSPAVAGDDPVNQEKIDRQLLAVDGTPNKQKLGANAILAASIAIAKAGALTKKVPLFAHLADCAGNDCSLTIPVPFFNILNGGQHAGMNLDFQEFIIIPNRAYYPSFDKQLEIGSGITHTLKSVLQAHHLPVTVGDEGGFAPLLHTNYAAIEMIEEACNKAHINFAESIFISFDFAANTYFKNQHYTLKDRPSPLTKAEYAQYLARLIEEFHPYSFEDPFPEDDWSSWESFTKQYGTKVKLIGDDLLVTNMERLEKAIDHHTCNAILIKPNQIGSVTEAIEVVNQAKRHHFITVASHRSGETTDTFIADFAVGVGTDYVKFGAPVRGERVAKYNRLLAIAREIES